MFFIREDVIWNTSNLRIIKRPSKLPSVTKSKEFLELAKLLPSLSLIFLQATV